MACPAKFRGRTNQPIHQANACGEARDAEFAKLQTWIAGTRRFSGEPQRAAGAATALAQVRGRPELQLHGHESCVVWLAALLALQRSRLHWPPSPANRSEQVAASPERPSHRTTAAGTGCRAARLRGRRFCDGDVL